MLHSKCVLPSGEVIGENVYMCWFTEGNYAQKGWFGGYNVRS